MHRSQLGGIIIDCETADLPAAAKFWSQALGYDQLPSTNPEDRSYVSLATGDNELDIEIQQVKHQSRVHIDIETDNIEAEAQRLEALGARRVSKVRDWQVMEAPTGQRFCLVNPMRADFSTGANRW